MLGVLSNYKPASISKRVLGLATLHLFALLSVAGGQEPSLREQAASARESNRIDDAIRLYRAAVAAEPAWTEGWWYLGTLLYDRDDFAPAANAFQHAVGLGSQSAPTLVMLGLSEAKIDKEEAALQHLTKARQLGIPPDSPLHNPMLFALATLWIKQGETRGGFDRAQEALDTLAREGLQSEELTTALGLAVLRRKAPGNEDALVQAAGLAETLAARRDTKSRAAYTGLVTRYGALSGVQFAFGKFLVSINDNEAAVNAFKAELQTSPSHLLARLGIAGLEAASQPSDAAKYAQQAVELAPDLPEAHYLLGFALFNLSEEKPDPKILSRAITELETARREAPEIAKIHFALSRAYGSADRREDAERALKQFERLNHSAH